MSSMAGLIPPAFRQMSVFLDLPSRMGTDHMAVVDPQPKVHGIEFAGNRCFPDAQDHLCQHQRRLAQDREKGADFVTSDR
jgi:hypothetical protein